MSLEKLILSQPMPLKAAREAVEVILEHDHGSEHFAVLMGVAYGMILGKRQERAKRKEHSP